MCFFTTNSLPINGVKELIKSDINIQKDIQIMCFDENDAFYISPYAMPFIKQPIKGMTRNAVELLLINQIEMKSEGTKNFVVEAKLVLNENKMYF